MAFELVMFFETELAAVEVTTGKSWGLLLRGVLFVVIGFALPIISELLIPLKNKEETYK